MLQKETKLAQLYGYNIDFKAFHFKYSLKMQSAMIDAKFYPSEVNQIQYTKPKLKLNST